MTIKNKKHIILYVGITCFLHACMHPENKIKGTDLHGYYKVGNPYEVQGKWYYPKKEPAYQEEGVASWYGPNFHGKRTANGAKFNTNMLTAAHRTLPLPSIVRVTNLTNDKSAEVMVNDRGPFAKDRIIDVSKQAASKLEFITQGTAKVRVELLPDKTKELLISMGLPAREVEANTAPVLLSKYQPASLSTQAPTEKTVQTSELSNLSPLPNVSTTTGATAIASKTIGQYVQVGTFSIKENAEKIQANLKDIGDVALNPVKVGDKSLYRVQIGSLKDQAEAKEALEKAISQGHPNALLVMN